MKLNWVKGLSPKEKEEMKLLFSSNALFRERAIAILQEKQNSLAKRNTLEDAYDSPNWALKQADAVGYARAMQEMISLFSK
jgi:hypothetical protein